MKKTFSKIISISLAILLLLSTMSFTVAKHFCGDFLVNVTYVVKSKGCVPDASVVTDNCEENIKAQEQDDCCTDEFLVIDGINEVQKVSSERITFNQLVFIASFYESYQFLFADLKEQKQLYKYYIPPILIFDIQLLHEVFII